MRKVSTIIIAISIICLVIIVNNNHNDTINNIKAEYYNISVGKSYYEGINKAVKSTTALLVNDYNKIKIIGITNQEINYDKSISIIFANDDKISSQLTIDDTGICHVGDEPDNYIIDNPRKIYEDGMKAYDEIKKINQKWMERRNEKWQM